MSGPKPVRLDKLLANMGYGSRREIAGLAKSGRIWLGDTPLRKPDHKVVPNPALQTELVIDRAHIDPLPGFAIMLHKPVGVTCSHKDPGPLLEDLLPERWRNRDPAVSPVGRLDKDTSGLIILTDDGQLNHRISTPRTQTPKVYNVTLDRPLSGTETDVFAAGTLMLESEEKPLLPAELEVHDEKHCTLTLHEGRYHQVRRMFASQGNHVVALHRASIGGLSLPDDLASGKWRMLNDDDISRLFQFSH